MRLLYVTLKLLVCGRDVHGNANYRGNRNRYRATGRNGDNDTGMRMVYCMCGKSVIRIHIKCDTGMFCIATSSDR